MYLVDSLVELPNIPRESSCLNLMRRAKTVWRKDIDHVYITSPSCLPCLAKSGHTNFFPKGTIFQSPPSSSIILHHPPSSRTHFPTFSLFIPLSAHIFNPLAWPSQPHLQTLVPHPSVSISPLLLPHKQGTFDAPTEYPARSKYLYASKATPWRLSTNVCNLSDIPTNA